MLRTLLIIVLIVFTITQVVLPIFLKDLRFFNWFRRSTPETPSGDLGKLSEEVEENTSKINETKKKVSEADKAITGMKTKIKNINK